MQSYLEIARQALRQAHASEREPTDTLYSDLAHEAMRRIAEVCPPGALKWARDAQPALTEKIDVSIIARLDALWANQAPLAEFQAALDELVSLHRDVGALFAKEP